MFEKFEQTYKVSPKQLCFRIVEFVKVVDCRKDIENIVVEQKKSNGKI